LAALLVPGANDDYCQVDCMLL